MQQEPGRFRPAKEQEKEKSDNPASDPINRSHIRHFARKQAADKGGRWDSTAPPRGIQKKGKGPTSSPIYRLFTRFDLISVIVKGSEKKLSEGYFKLGDVLDV